MDSKAPGGTHRAFPASESADINFEWMALEQPERVLFHSVNLQRASFLYTDVSGVNFVDVSWPRDGGGSMDFPGRHEWEPEPHFERPHSLPTLEWLERLCQQLKLNFENKRNYAEAGEFHWAEMEYRRQRNWMNGKWLSALMLDLYKLASGYGERIGKAAAILLGIFVLTFFFQARLGIWHAPYATPEKHDPPEECLFADGREYRTYQAPLVTNPECAKPVPGYEVFGHAAKFTLLDITLQKPDEYVPATWHGRVLSLLSRLFFPIQLGLLLVAINRRFRR